jgi:WD40 repeat protein
MVRFPSGAGPIHAVTFSPDGRRLVIDAAVSTGGSREGAGPRLPRELVWWDVRTATAVRRFRLWDTLLGPRGALRGTPQEPYGYPEDEPPIDVSFCPRTDRVVIAWPWGSLEDPVCVWDLAGDAPECLCFWARTRLCRVAFAPDGGRIALAVEYQKIDAYGLRIWPTGQAGEGRRAGQFAWESLDEDPRVDLPGGATALAFDGRYAAVKVEDWWGGRQTEDGAYLWDTRAPGPAAVRELAPGFTPRCFAFAPRDPLLALGGRGLAVWHLGKGQWIATANPPAEVKALAFDPSGRTVAVGREDGAVQFWEWEKGRLAAARAPGAGAVTAVAFAPDGLTCAAGGADGQVGISDPGV